MVDASRPVKAIETGIKQYRPMEFGIPFIGRTKHKFGENVTAASFFMKPSGIILFLNTTSGLPREHHSKSFTYILDSSECFKQFLAFSKGKTFSMAFDPRSRHFVFGGAELRLFHGNLRSCFIIPRGQYCDPHPKRILSSIDEECSIKGAFKVNESGRLDRLRIMPMMPNTREMTDEDHLSIDLGYYLVAEGLDKLGCSRDMEIADYNTEDGRYFNYLKHASVKNLGDLTRTFEPSEMI